MSTSDTPQPDADVRTLQIVWGALIAGVALATAVMGGLAFASQDAALAEDAETFFLINAAVSILAVIGAFAVQRRMVDRLPAQGTRAELIATVRTSGVLSLALLEGSALLACIAALLTGELINLAFVVPFFAFAVLFFPTAARLDALFDVARRG
jgi:uncharacterized membrane protein YiaA